MPHRREYATKCFGRMLPGLNVQVRLQAHEDPSHATPNTATCCIYIYIYILTSSVKVKDRPAALTAASCAPCLLDSQAGGPSDINECSAECLGAAVFSLKPSFNPKVFWCGLMRAMLRGLVAFLAVAAADDVKEALEMETCGEDCALNALQMRGSIGPEPGETLGVTAGVNATSSVDATSSVNASWRHAGCCSGCYTAYCSPNSGTCYSYKGKYYYLTCSSDTRRRRTQSYDTRRRRSSSWHDYAYNNCCSSCTSWYYCSPKTGSCYDTKDYDYFYKC